MPGNDPCFFLLLCPHTVDYAVPPAGAKRIDLRSAAPFLAYEVTQRALDEAVRIHADLTGAILTLAVLKGAVLKGAVLKGAVLTNAVLAGANLTGADLTGADLRGADLTGANLSYADLTGADLSYANFTDANFTGAVLTGADLTGTNLIGVNLTKANLAEADLSEIQQDFYRVLDAAPNEVRALQAVLRDGKIDGSFYEGPCACLIGTIANARGCDYLRVPNIRPNSTRPAERWFLALSPGHTPENHPVATITSDWIDAWLTQRGSTGGA